MWEAFSPSSLKATHMVTSQPQPWGCSKAGEPCPALGLPRGRVAAGK